MTHAKPHSYQIQTIVVPLMVYDDSVFIPVQVNGQDLLMVVDTGDAIGPVFSSGDAAQLQLPRGDPLGITGAGGATQVVQTVVTVALGPLLYENEPGAIDDALQGPSLLGLPFFLRNIKRVEIDFHTHEMVIQTG